MALSLAMGRRGGNDARFFTTTKKGEMHELKEELNHPKMEKKRDAVKKVIAAMTVGKDVSVLFTDVVVRRITFNVIVIFLIGNWIAPLWPLWRC